jgi:hypothetical protein
MNKDTLIDLYWILDTVQKGGTPNLRHVGEGFIAIRDQLMQPDTEEIVEHIRGALQQQAAADALTRHAIGQAQAWRGVPPAPSAARALPEQGLRDMMAALPPAAPEDLAVTFGRLVEAAHGIGGD